MSDIIVAPQQRDLEALAAPLERWLSARMPEARGLRVTDLAYPRGAGQSHETILAGIGWQQDGAPRSGGLVFRCKPSQHLMFPDDLFAQQFELMRLLHGTGIVRVAKPLWLDEDPELLGAPFFVMEKVAGRVPVSVPPYASGGWVAEATPEQRRRMWRGGVEQLAALQRLSPDQAQFLAGPDHARDGLAQEWDKYTRFAAWVQQDRAFPVLDAGIARLKSLWPRHQPPGVVWGDARLGNIMFDDNFDVVAVMDWEQPSLGGALHDLAWWLVLSEMMHGETPQRPHLAGMGTRRETIALWESLTGISAADIEWYEDFTRLKLSCLNIRMAALRGWPAPDEAELARRMKLG